MNASKSNIECVNASRREQQLLTLQLESWTAAVALDQANPAHSLLQSSVHGSC
jgi:acetolactate synthase regulatory subunit